MSAAIGAALLGPGTFLIGAAALNTGGGEAGGPLRRRAVALLLRVQREQELSTGHTLMVLGRGIEREIGREGERERDRERERQRERERGREGEGEST